MGNMSLNLLLALLLVAVASPFSSSAQQIPTDATAYEVLGLFGLQSGLLPASVKSYSYNPDDRRFIVVLSNPCYVLFSRLFYYEDTITGVLEYGAITEVKGISILRFFMWMDVSAIRVNAPPSDSIDFYVDFISIRLGAGEFLEVRSCSDNGGCATAGNLKQQHLLQQPVTSAAQVEIDALTE